MTFLTRNRQWISAVFAMVFASGGFYVGNSYKFDALEKQLTVSADVDTNHEIRLKKIEESLSVMKMVADHQVRIEALEQVVNSSREDRAKINANLDAVRRSLDTLVQMHMSNSK